MEKSLIRVFGIVMCHEKCLLLKQAKKPKLWTGPSGVLFMQEIPADALKRVIKDSTGLEVEVSIPVDIWEDIEDEEVRWLSYVCISKETNITLTEAHSHACWVSFDEIDDGDLKIVCDTSRWVKSMRVAHLLNF